MHSGLLPSSPDDLTTQIHWHGFEVQLPIGRLGRLTYHRMRDIEFLKSLVPKRKNFVLGEARKWKRELMVIKLKEEWRTGQEDQILEILYDTPFVNSSQNPVDKDDRYQEILNYERTIDAITQPRGFRRPIVGNVRAAPEKKKNKKKNRVTVASFPKLGTMNLVRQNNSIACVEALEEEVNEFRRVLRNGKRSGKNCFGSLVNMVETSRHIFCQHLRTVCKEIDAKQKAMKKGHAKQLRRIAANGIATKLGALKAHGMARMIQGWYRKARRRKCFKAGLEKLRNLNSFCRRHVAQYRLRRAVLLCQSHFKTLLTHMEFRDRRCAYRVDRMTRRNSVCRIIRWYRFYRLLRISHKRWTKGAAAAAAAAKNNKYWTGIASEKKNRIVAIQCQWRCKLARKCFFWKRQFWKLRLLRKQKNLWKSVRRLKMVRDTEESMVLTKFYVSREQEKADREIEQEHKRFAIEWKESKMKAQMSIEAPRKLPKGWKYEIDTVTNQEMYVHKKSGKSQLEHPHVTKLKLKLSRKMVEAQRKLNQKLGEIASFCLRLKNGQGVKLKALESEKWNIIHSVLNAERIELKRTSLALNVDGTINEQNR
mmetsp:Transcript_47874/g.79324  ORF Transcript_47874/g.79324 Transcript_47874/m.79324 type:complete len:593 (+) Transcript_47874:206-1984(+)